eukprot:1890967-Amphidinium_carterae.1
MSLYHLKLSNSGNWAHNLEGSTLLWCLGGSLRNLQATIFSMASLIQSLHFFSSCGACTRDTSRRRITSTAPRTHQ